MSCFHPLKGFKVGVNPSGKDKYLITSYDAKGVIKNRLNEYVPYFDDTPKDMLSPRVTDYIDIPCGHCIGCLLDRSRQWADRCVLEATYHEHNCFITLTYDDDHLPEKRECVNPLTAEVSISPYSPLRKKDFQDFMKRLRDRINPVKIRFFACGEYGSNTHRCHYHAIIFGYDFPDKVYWKSNFRGEKYYLSKLLNECWSKGNTTVTDISWDTCAYVARYCLKKRNNDMSVFLDTFNLDPEFTLMSRKPGIGRLYYEDHKEDIYKYGLINIGDANGQRQIRPPKYFDRLYDIDYPSDFEEIKAARKKFVENNKLQIELDTDLCYIDYLKVKEHNLKKRTNIFNERSGFNDAG